MDLNSIIDVSSLLEQSYREVNYKDFYRDVFPLGSLEEKGVYEVGKYNAIARAIKVGDNKTKRYIVTDDLDVLDKLVECDDFCIIRPISFIGKSAKSDNARFMYAMAIDLDGIKSKKNFDFLIHQISNGHNMLSVVWGLPKPTYLVSSGTGIHLYYVFEKPIPLFKNVVKGLERLKKRLTWQAWTQGASVLSDNVQYESLFQGFRMVGTVTKNGGRCRAFKVGNKVTIEYLNKYVPEEYQVETIVYQSKLTLKVAKELYPEWYKKRIINKQLRGSWVCKKDLYDWWIRTLKECATEGHRYWCIMTLCTYAKKCGVSREVLEKDAYGLIPFMNSLGSAFTEDDVLHALQAYDDSYITYPIKTIEERTDIKIERNKRNGRKQKQHLERARAVQEIDYPNGEWRNQEGRPKGSGKRNIVKEWRDNNPDGKKIDCERETGLSRHTILKWWNYENDKTDS
jgi:conserved domain protein